MPSRILRDSYATSESVALIEPGAQDRLPRYFLLADDFGVFSINEAVIVGRIFPLRPDMTPQRVAADLSEYVRVGVIEVWECDGKRFAEFPNWFKHQRQPRAGTKRKFPDRPRESAATRSGPQESAGNGTNARSQAQSQAQASFAGAGAVGDTPPLAGSFASLPPDENPAPARYPHVQPALHAYKDRLGALRGGFASEPRLPGGDKLARFDAACAALTPTVAGTIMADEIHDRIGRGKLTSPPTSLAYLLEWLENEASAGGTSRRGPKRGVGENPKPGDPDYDNREAWWTLSAFDARERTRRAE